MDASTQSVKERLEHLMEQIGTILTLSDHASPDFNLDPARVRLRELKDHLGVEYHRMSTTKGEAALSEAEKTWYRPVVHEMWSRALIQSIRPDHPPEKWRSSLFDAEDILRGHLTNLRQALESDAKTP